jgi:hypothetical protein
MTLKELVSNYIIARNNNDILENVKGLKNNIIKCQCDLSNLMYCRTPHINCEVIEKHD